MMCGDVRASDRAVVRDNDGWMEGRLGHLKASRLDSRLVHWLRRYMATSR